MSQLKKYSTILCLCLLSFCSKEQDASDLLPNSEDAISSPIIIGTRVDGSDSATTTSAERVVSNIVTESTINVFPVWALKSDDSSFIAEYYYGSLGDFINGSKFWPSEDLYWYSIASKSNFGYSSTPELTQIATKKDGCYHTPYSLGTTDVNLANVQDVVVAYAETAADKTEGNVSFDFVHILSQIEIKAKVGSDARHLVNIAGVSLYNICTEGDFIFPASSDYTTVEWSGVTGSGAISTQSSASMQLVNGANAENIHQSNYDFWVVPQTATAQTGSSWSTGFCIKVLCRITSLDGELIYPYPEYVATYGSGETLIEIGGEYYAWVGVPILTGGDNTSIWSAGTKYTYTLNFTNGAGYADPKISDSDDPMDVLGGVVSISVEVDDYGVENDVEFDLSTDDSTDVQ